MDKRIKNLVEEIGRDDLYRQDLSHCPNCGNKDCSEKRVGDLETDYSYMYEHCESVCPFCGLVRPYTISWRIDEGDWEIENVDKWRFGE